MLRNIVALLLAVAPLGAGDWLTFGYDLQRTGWTREEKTLTRANAANLGVLWKVQLPAKPRELTTLTAPIVVSGVETPQGTKTVIYTVGSYDDVYALDAASGETVWTKKMRVTSAPTGKDHWLCPQGVNATPTVDKADNTLYVIASDGKLHRMDLSAGEAKWQPLQFVPPFSKNWSLSLKDGVLYTTISQGCGAARSGIYALDMRDANQPVVRFLFTGKRGGAGIWGRAGAPISESGRIIGATGDGPFNVASSEFGSSIVAGRGGDLKLVDWYTPPNWDELNRLDLDIGCTNGVIFRHNGRELYAVGAKEGLIYLLDTNNLGGKDHQSGLYTSPRYSNDGQSFEGHGIWGALSTYVDEKNTRWLYVPTWGPLSKDLPKFPHSYGPTPSGTVMAFKVVTDSTTKKPSLEPGWLSPDMGVPEPVVIANGVVFALSNGENVRQTVQGGRIDWKNLKVFATSDRLENTRRAVLYALDATTGKTLYSSGEAIQAFTHFSAPVVADGKVFVVDYAAQVYAFGLK